MSRYVRVVHTLRGLGKARDAAELAERTEALHAAGEELVRVALMPHIEHEAVRRRVIDPVQRDSELHGAEVRRQMPASAREALHEEGADLPAEDAELLIAQGAEIGGLPDFIQIDHKRLRLRISNRQLRR